MFEEYTPEARRAVFFAHGTAVQLGSKTIDGMHLLLGLAREDIALVNRFLTSSVSQGTFASEAMTNAPKLTGALEQFADVPFGKESKQIFSFAAEEAERMSQHSVGIEHLLLGLLREEKSHAARMLRERGADVGRTREELLAHPYQPPAREQRTLRELENLNKTLADLPKRTSVPRKDDIFLRYKGNARLAVFGATYEAARLGSPAVKPEHLLLCLLKTNFVSFRSFVPLAGSTGSVCKHIEEQIADRNNVTPSNEALARLPSSDEYQRVLNYAQEEATLLRSEYIAPEHLLLGVLREKESYAAGVMCEYGADLERIRRELAA